MKTVLLILAVLLQGPAPQIAGGGGVTGRLSSSDGAPAPNVRIAVVDTRDAQVPAASQTLVAITQTDSDGRYRLENVPAGRYYIVAGLLDSPTYFPGVPAEAAAMIVTVTAGGVFQGFDFRLATPAASRVAGRVVREGDPAIRGNRPLQVRLINPPMPASIANVAVDGTFEFVNVRPGRYTVAIGPGIQIPARPLTVVDKDITDLELLVPLSAVVTAPMTGTVAVENDGLQPPIRLRLSAPGQRNPVRTLSIPDNSKSYTGEAPIGDFSVAAELPVGYSIKSMVAGSTDLLTGMLKVTPAGSPSIALVLGVSTPPPWVRLSGRITGAGNPNAPQANMITLEGNGAAPIPATIAPDGSFVVARILPGTYSGRLVPQTDEFIRTVVVGNTDVSGIEIPLVIPAFKISGTVTDEVQRQPGRQASNQDIRSMLRPSANGGQGFAGEVLLDGTFTFPRVPPGSYILSFGLSTRGSDTGIIAGSPLTVTVTDKDVTGLVVPSLSR